MNFKDQFAIDAAVFFNPDEFGEKHTVEGRELVIVIDSDELLKRKASATNPDDGIHDAEILFHAKREDFPGRPEVDSWLSLDGRQYRIVTIQEDEVSYTVGLTVTRS